jgi:hypothetical protein
MITEKPFEKNKTILSFHVANRKLLHHSTALRALNTM